MVERTKPNMPVANIVRKGQHARGGAQSQSTPDQAHQYRKRVRKGQHAGSSGAMGRWWRNKPQKDKTETQKPGS